jgi:hypothetical protein
VKSFINKEQSISRAQKVGVVAEDRFPFLHSLFSEAQFQTIIQYSRECKGAVYNGELKKNTLDKRKYF